MIELIRGNRVFRLLLVAKVTSVFGDNMMMLALPYFLFVRTGSVVSSASVFIVATLPNVFLGPFLGSLADRVRPRWLLIGCDVLSGFACLGLVWVVRGGPHWVIYVIAFVLVSCSQAVNFTRGAVTPRIVAPESLMRANSLESVAMSVVRLVAPPVGGILYAAIGLGWLVAVNAATFVVSAACVAMLRLPAPLATVARESVWQGLKAARETIRSGGPTRRLIVVASGYFLAGAAMTVLLVPFIRGRFEGSAAAIGLLSGAGAIGALLGAVLGLQAEQRLGVHRALGLMLVVEGGSRLAFTVMPTLWGCAVFSVTSNAASAAFLALLQTALQGTVPTAYMGRVIGITFSVAGFCSIAGMVAFSFQAQSLGSADVLRESALLCAALGVAAVWMLRHHARTASQQLEPAAASH